MRFTRYVFLVSVGSKARIKRDDRLLRPGGIDRDVPRILVTSESRRGSPVRSPPPPGALWESSGLSIAASLVDGLHLGILSTCFSTTYLRASPVHARSHVLCSRYFRYALSATTAESSRAPHGITRKNSREFPRNKKSEVSRTGRLPDVTFDV